jgi:predicted metal-dependent hydrolase
LKEERIHKIEDLEFKVIYSRRRTIGISILPDSSVIVRVPYLTSLKTITRIVNDKYAWVIKHRDNYRHPDNMPLNRSYTSGEKHLFRGSEKELTIEESFKPYIRFNDNKIELGTEKTEDQETIRRLLYKGYKNEAMVLYPLLLNRVLLRHENQNFRPAGLVIRTMKRRWGSCSGRGVITLSTELVKLDDHYIEYVITHELCHLKHHNHGAGFYNLLSELFPDWKTARKELRKYIQ